MPGAGGHPGPHLGTARSHCLPGGFRVLFPFAFVPGDGQGGRDSLTCFKQKLYTIKKPRPHPGRTARREHGGLTPRGELFPPGEPRRGQPPRFARRGRWRGAAPRAAGAARSLAVPGEAGACRASLATWFPLGKPPTRAIPLPPEEASPAASSSLFLGSFSQHVATAAVRPRVRGREHGSCVGDEDSSALWRPSSMLVSSHLCLHPAWHTACVGSSLAFLALPTSGAIDKLLISGADQRVTGPVGVQHSGFIAMGSGRESQQENLWSGPTGDFPPL